MGHALRFPFMQGGRSRDSMGEEHAGCKTTMASQEKVGVGKNTRIQRGGNKSGAGGGMKDACSEAVA